MFDELHAYYDRELGYIRKLAGEFAEQHPKIAGRLRLSGEATDDPHVERLLQGFAFIAARIHRKLDDDFPELTQGLLEVLYPHYLAPIPQWRSSNSQVGPTSSPRFKSRQARRSRQVPFAERTVGFEPHTR